MKSINNNELRLSNVDQTVTLYGFIATRRKLGELTFFDLRDRWGVTQLVVRGALSPITKESVVKVTGVVRERTQANSELATGQIELEVFPKDFEVLSAAAPLPFNITNELNDVKEDLRLTYRYLDLRRAKMAERLVFRHRFIKACRDYLDKADFLEVETPYLSKTTPEGARDFIVPTRRAKHFFALPQSPQLYKQLLMVAGVERYFQVVRALRDEDLRKDRQYEFTQLDIEVSFGNQETIVQLVEAMLQQVFKKLGLTISTPFAKMDYDVALRDYGSDKPDLRFGYLLKEVNTLSVSSKQHFGEANLQSLVIPNTLDDRILKQLAEIVQKNGAKRLWSGVKVNAEAKLTGNLSFLTASEQAALDFKAGTLLIVAGEREAALKALGAVRTELNNLFNYSANARHEFVWIVNWPLFEIDQQVISAAHHPFTAPTLESLASFNTNPQKARAQAYDLVLNGFEIAGGSVRITDWATQRKMFETIGLKQEQYESKFGFFLEAFKYGMPPHCGIAFGLDRLLMILTEADSIRDVIAFPKNAHGKALMEGAPSLIEPEALTEYSLSFKSELSKK